MMDILFNVHFFTPNFYHFGCIITSQGGGRMDSKFYICIDLKTFYASVECVERGLDPFTTNLVVADPSRGKGAICLAISPALKALGIKNRCRLFEIPDGVEYITAMPRMKLYMEYSTRIYSIYLRYISKEDIHPYSIDEMFLDVTNYLELYNTTPEKIARALLNKIYDELGLTATAGIGTNLFLCKVALDIKAKKTKTNIAFLDEEKFKEELWDHQPLSSFWQIAHGIERRLNRLGIYTMRDLARANEDILYKEFGINAEILIDHSKGIEPVTIKDIKAYKTKSHSISQSQVLFEDYEYDKARLIVKEMVEVLSFKLIDEHLVTSHVSLGIGYSKDTIKSTGGSMKMNICTNVYSKLLPYFLEIFDRTTNKDFKIRRVGISFGNVMPEDHEYFNLFTTPEEVYKERKLQETISDIKKKYGKSSVIKAMNLEEGATTLKRNKLIGGHNAETKDEDK